MRHIILSAVLVATVFVMSGAEVSAAQASSRGRAVAARRGPIARLIELERRKNEWLRSVFLGGR